MTLETAVIGALIGIVVILAVGVGGVLVLLGVRAGREMSKGVWEIAKDNDFTSRPGQHVDSALPDVTE